MDWRLTEKTAIMRQNQKTGNGANEGIFASKVDTASGETQSAKLTYAGGERNIPLPMPFDSTFSWIRSIPEAGTQALACYRQDTGDACFITYINENPSKKLDQYRAGLSVYRTLMPVEHEIHSSGYAQTYYSARPILEQRGGVIRSWLDQDRAECGQKAPLHTRQILEHASNSIGDEERFGVVRRPSFVLDPVTIVLVGGLNSYNFNTYPYPDFTLPGGIPALSSLAAKAVAEASAVAAAAVGKFKVRFFGKEYLRVIKNCFPLPSNLVDIREGHVFDDFGIQQFGGTGAYLRAKHSYYTSMLDSTTFTVDEMGNVSWTLSVGCFNGGWSTLIPLGSWKLSTGADLSGTGVDIKTLGTVGITTSLGYSSTSLTTTSISSLLSTSVEGKVSRSDSTKGTHSIDAGLTSSYKSQLNTAIEAGVMMDVKAGSLMNLKAPIVTIGQSPSTPCVLGTELATWLNQLLTAFVSNAAYVGMGNLGAPAPLNPAILSVIQTLQGQIPTLLSTSITVTK
jgi:hypothetical protein